MRTTVHIRTKRSGFALALNVSLPRHSDLGFTQRASMPS